ncbi:MAG: carboxypeptidase-like regulatory domain-containing protein [Planctomycetota bacterium]
MNVSSQRWILGGLAVLLALVGLAWFLAGVEDARGIVERPDQPALTPTANSSAPRRTQLTEPKLVAPTRTDRADLYTTVLWPLEIELELVEARHRPKAKGAPAAGSGADARLAGTITGAQGEPVPGVRVTFLEGANAGRTLVATNQGRFGANDLYPGLSVLEVRGPGILGSRREVRLRSRKETLLNIPYGRPAAVFGSVYDHAGEPLPNAEVLFDGVKVFTDTEGAFYIAKVAGGPCLVEVSAEGHATERQIVNVASGRVMERDRIAFRLQQASTLELICRDRVGGPGPIQVTLLPSDYSARTFPWYSVNPVLVEPGVPTRVEGLPRGAVRVLGFREGALVAERGANLRPTRPTEVQLTLTEAPKLTGVVTRDGEPVAGALVRMEAPDRVQAMLSFHRRPSFFLETAVMDFPAPALQEVETRGDGSFELTAWDDIAPDRYLEVWGPDNTTWAGRVVKRGERRIELELKELTHGRSSLELDIVGRHMALPISVTVNGQPHAELILPADEPLVIDSLVEGVWRLSARWQARVVQQELLIELDGVDTRPLATIPEIIEGQTAEEWSRAGRDWPGPPD